MTVWVCHMWVRELPVHLQVCQVIVTHFLQENTDVVKCSKVLDIF